MTTEETTIIPAGEGPDIETLVRADTPAIWEDFSKQFEKLKATAETLTVTDSSQKAEMKLARQTRLTFKDLRVAIEKRRKELGEQYLRKSQKINADAKALKDLIEPFEARLLEQEEFADRKAAAALSALNADRTAKLIGAGGNPSLYASLGSMKEEDFVVTIAGLIAAREARLAAEREAEEKRTAQVKAEADERERIRKENERLKSEAIAMEAARKEAEQVARKEREALEAEREAAEAVARKEREAREKIEAEIERKRLEEATARQAEVDARAAAAKAPDKDKLTAFASHLRSLEIPVLTSEEGKSVLVEINAQAEKFAAWVEKKARSL